MLISLPGKSSVFQSVSIMKSPQELVKLHTGNFTGSSMDLALDEFTHLFTQQTNKQTNSLYLL